jgi:DNA-binding MarR family transcriptional regulator
MNAEQYSLAKVDRTIHEPARGAILAILSGVDTADFLFLQQQTGLTKGNLSAHLSRLEAAHFIQIEKTYRGKVPRTICRLTELGRQAFENYREQLKAFVESHKETMGDIR